MAMETVADLRKRQELRKFVWWHIDGYGEWRSSRMAFEDKDAATRAAVESGYERWAVICTEVHTVADSDGAEYA